MTSLPESVTSAITAPDFTLSSLTSTISSLPPSSLSALPSASPSLLHALVSSSPPTPSLPHAQALSYAVLDLGIDVNVSSPPHGASPLHAAADAHPDIIRTLVHLGADIHASDQRGNSPLHAAALALNPEAVHTLLELGGNVHATNNDGHTPAMLAQAADKERDGNDLAKTKKRVLSLLRIAAAAEEMQSITSLRTSTPSSFAGFHNPSTSNSNSSTTTTSSSSSPTTTTDPTATTATTTTNTPPPPPPRTWTELFVLSAIPYTFSSINTMSDVAISSLTWKITLLDALNPLPLPGQGAHTVLSRQFSSSLAGLFYDLPPWMLITLPGFLPIENVTTPFFYPKAYVSNPVEKPEAHLATIADFCTRALLARPIAFALASTLLSPTAAFSIPTLEALPSLAAGALSGYGWECVGGSFCAIFSASAALSSSNHMQARPKIRSSLFNPITTGLAAFFLGTPCFAIGSYMLVAAATGDPISSATAISSIYSSAGVMGFYSTGIVSIAAALLKGAVGSSLVRLATGLQYWVISLTSPLGDQQLPASSSSSSSSSQPSLPANTQ